MVVTNAPVFRLGISTAGTDRPRRITHLRSERESGCTMKTKISLVFALVTISAAPAWAGGRNDQGDASTEAGSPKTRQSASRIWRPENQPDQIKSLPIKSSDLTTPPKKSLVKLPPDGRVASGSTAAANLVPSKPGYVWKGDHWERAKATSVVIHDHRHDGAVVPQDPNGLSNVSTFGPLASSPPPAVLHAAAQQSGRPAGGVTVTIRPNSRNDVIGGY